MPRPEQLRVNEIFHSIQGEGTRAGRRCVFVRLTGCNLRCTYCDTEYAFYEGEWMTLDEIASRVRAYGCGFVEVTGGEPLLQPNVHPLLRRLCDEFETVALETSGALSIAGVDARVVRIVDLKTPSSGECEQNCWENIPLLTPRDEAKFVIGSREDYEWSRGAIRRYDLPARCTVLVSPVIGNPNAAGIELYRGGLEPRLLAEWVLDDRLDVVFGVQLHKRVWPVDARGV